MPLSNINIQELSAKENHISYCKLLKQLSVIDPDSIDYNDFIDRLEQIQKNPLHKILIAKIDDLIIGSITILIEPKFIHNLSNVAHIEDVVVDERYRGMGIGRLLVQNAIQISNQYQCYKIILDCSENNVQFYEKIGLQIKGVQMAKYF